jgi:hypothetical protein
VEKIAPGTAAPAISQPVQTGIMAIDAMIPDRPGSARADHRRPLDRQDDHLHRH